MTSATLAINVRRAVKGAMILAVIGTLSGVAIYVTRKARSPAAAAQSRADIVFAGYSFTDTEALFALADSASGRSSGWLKIGQSFAGCTVASFDPAHETITLRWEGELLELPLQAKGSAAAPIFFQVKTGRTEREKQLEFSAVDLKQVVEHFAAVSGRKITVAPEIGVLKVTGHFRTDAVNSFFFRLPEIVPVRIEFGTDGSVHILPK